MFGQFSLLPMGFIVRKYNRNERLIVTDVFNKDLHCKQTSKGALTGFSGNKSKQIYRPILNLMIKRLLKEEYITPYWQDSGKIMLVFTIKGCLLWQELFMHKNPDAGDEHAEHDYNKTTGLDRLYGNIKNA